MTVHILIAEDDQAIRELLAHHLEREGMSPILATDGQQALRHLRASPLMLALIDVGLPGVDGFEIARTIRREGNDIPLVFLTARTEEIDRIVGLEIGADDYLTKPFSYREVIARIRAILRRWQKTPVPFGATLRVERLEIDESAREARIDGKDIGLKPREFSLLAMLVRNAGVALSRDTLIERVWSYDFEGDPRTVDVHIRRLRRQLQEVHGLPDWIRTVHNFGYKFVLPVAS